MEEGGEEMAGFGEIDIDEDAFGAAEEMDGGPLIGRSLFVLVSLRGEPGCDRFPGCGGDPFQSVDNGQLPAEFPCEGELFIGE